MRILGFCAALLGAARAFQPPRPAALSLLVTMAAAVYFHVASTGLQGAPFGHVENYSYNFEEPALYGLIFLLFFFNGPGPLSVDSAIYSALAPDDDD